MIQFCEDVKESLQLLNYTTDLKEMINEYNSSLSEVVKKHAPVLAKTISVTSDASLLDVEYVSLHKFRRKAERRYRKSRLDNDKKAYQFLQNRLSNYHIKRKKEFVSSKLKQE